MKFTPMRTVAFDLDGTLIEQTQPVKREHDPYWDDPIGEVTFLEPVMNLARGFQNAGLALAIVTGRTDHHALRISRILGEAGLHIPTERIATNGPKWDGWKNAVTRKAQALERLDAMLFIGDQDHLDGAAAKEAGIPYLSVKSILRKAEEGLNEVSPP